MSRPMFTFRTSSQKPYKTVWCHRCDWRVSGNGQAIFPQADAHQCLAEPSGREEPGEGPSAPTATRTSDQGAVLSGLSESSHYQRCPVCGGNGIVPNGFYTQTTGVWTTGSTAPEQCRTCAGRGIVR